MSIRLSLPLLVLILVLCIGREPSAARATDEVHPIPRALPGAPDLPPDLRASLATALSANGPDYVPRTRHRRADGSPIYSNRLLLESSPYLQQHAHNPVNWFPWGDEAFETARRLGRPVLISIGYSTCHWCHVMEEESFDDLETATDLNARFIAIKVDREIRPDVDAVYMKAAQALTGQGGWPLNVWATPDREPFYAGTYFPPDDHRGRPAFRSVLESISKSYASRPDQIEASARRLTARIREQIEGPVAVSTEIPPRSVFDSAFEQVKAAFDPVNGGVGQRPKFPSSLPVRFLLRHHRRTGDERALAMVRMTLEKMAGGGLQDQIGGGFHRYSTDAAWLVPHFEKMLYDNAILAVTYLEAWQATGEDEFALVARKTLDYVAREMTAPNGGFYSATDADSLTPDGHAEEGYFFTWTPAEIDASLQPADARAIKAYYNVTETGNLAGRNILHVAQPATEVARQLGIAPPELSLKIERALPVLYDKRALRVAPHLDDKILVAWNGLMISAFARAGFALNEPSYTRRAIQAAEFILARLRQNGRLMRHFSRGRAEGNAFLDDYAFLIAGLLDLYEANADLRWLREAIALQGVLDRHHADGSGGGYFATADDHEILLARDKPGYDGAEPSGNSVALLNLLRLSEWTAQPAFYESAVLTISAFRDLIESSPSAFGQMLLALDYIHDEPKEIVLVRPKGGDAERLLAGLREAFVPNRVVAVVSEGDGSAEWIPLAAGKTAQGGRATAYVCKHGVCAYPTSDPEVFARQIRAVTTSEGRAAGAQ